MEYLFTRQCSVQCFSIFGKFGTSHAQSLKLAVLDVPKYVFTVRLQFFYDYGTIRLDTIDNKNITD